MPLSILVYKNLKTMHLLIKWIFSEVLLVASTIFVFIAHSFRRVNKLALDLKVLWNIIQSYLYIICFLSTNTCTHKSMQSHPRTVLHSHYVLWNDDGSEYKLKQMVSKLWGFSKQLKKSECVQHIIANDLFYQLNSIKEKLSTLSAISCVYACVHIQKREQK